MVKHRMFILVTACTTLVACGGRPVVALAPNADASSARWNAVIGTPEALAGVVQSRGAASLSSTKDGRETRVEISLENAVPRGRHPWVIRSGQCGGMGATLLQVSDKRSLEVDDDGKAKASANIELSYPTSGDYMIAVLASTENMERVVACGNFAPPINR
jgi:hypothetical protein